MKAINLDIIIDEINKLNTIRNEFLHYNSCRNPSEEFKNHLRDWWNIQLGRNPPHLERGRDENDR